jgi:hypothetical protein
MMMEQSCSMPIAPTTIWHITLEVNQDAEARMYEDCGIVPPGALVQVLQSDDMKHYNGCFGVVTGDEVSDGQYVVHLSGTDSNETKLTVATDNLCLHRCTTLKSKIHRMHPLTCGTLQSWESEGHGNTSTVNSDGIEHDFRKSLISFEWIDRPSHGLEQLQSPSIANVDDFPPFQKAIERVRGDVENMLKREEEKVAEFNLFISSLNDFDLFDLYVGMKLLPRSSLFQNLTSSHLVCR